MDYTLRPCNGGPGWDRTIDQSVMHPTITFVTPFGFVSWTIPCPAWGLCRLVSTPSRFQAWLGITIAITGLRFPRI